MAVNKPAGDNARKGAVRKRSQLKTKLGGVTAWTKRNSTSGEFMAVKTAKKAKAGTKAKAGKAKAGKKAVATKFKGVRREKAGSRR